MTQKEKGLLEIDNKKCNGCNFLDFKSLTCKKTGMILNTLTETDGFVTVFKSNCPFGDNYCRDLD